MKALIITGGECPPSGLIRRLAERASLIIAADSGFDSARKAGIEPDLIVGDFDSVEDKAALAAFPVSKIIKFPMDKDDTDTEIAVSTATARGADYLMIAGGGGGRLDHLLAMSCLFDRGETAPREWHTSRESVYYIRQGELARFTLGQDSIVSVFPVGALEGCRGMTSSGLKWPLEGLNWPSGYFGISNRALGGNAEILAGSSDLLVILPAGSECFFQDGKAF
ncbi:MAG: thiamine diphosphokinase [Spirochaetales bacterium]|jgi:thiamine pyrophosphokinase